MYPIFFNILDKMKKKKPENVQYRHKDYWEFRLFKNIRRFFRKMWPK